MKLESLRDAADRNHLLVHDAVVPQPISQEAWRHAHDVGLLVRIHHGVSRTVDTAETPELLIAAAGAAARPSAGTDRSLAAGRAAAYLMGIAVPPADPIHGR